MVNNYSLFAIRGGEDVASKSKKQPNKFSTKKTVIVKKKKKEKKKLRERINVKLTVILILLFGVLFIFAAYAWFSSSLNVRIRTFRMAVDRNSGLTISLDAINYDSYVEINEETLITNLNNLYPTHMSQWSINGLTPVSSNGITNPNSPQFNIFASDGVLYQRNDRDNGFIVTEQLVEDQVKRYSYYIAFDIFLRNETGSPVSDNLYLNRGALFALDDGSDEEMQGLANSVRFGIVKIGSTSLDATATEAQNLSCNNDCESIIYEPNSRNHTDLSIERAQKYNVSLVNGERFPTYAFSREGGPIFVRNTVSGSPNIDLNYFSLQETITDEDLGEPLFTIPNGVTKARIYLWIEGQDIDSLETNSAGADMNISVDFVKDTTGYDAFNE